MGDDRWWRGFHAVVVDAVARGSRVLDVGCGDGGLVERLATGGFDALGVDPQAPPRPRLLQKRVEEVGPIGPFDVVCAVMSGADNSVTAWQLDHADLHTGATLRSRISDAFDLRSDTPRPYLARMLGQHRLEDLEEAMIAEGALPALGRWYVASS